MFRLGPLLLSAALLVGCGVFIAPSPTPAEMDDVIAALVLRGVTVHTLVSGDAGCPGSSLHSNGVHMELEFGSLVPTQDVYLLRWRRSSDYDAAAATWTECLAEYRSLHPGTAVDSIEVPPWRAYSPNWTEALRIQLDYALHAAGGG